MPEPVPLSADRDGVRTLTLNRPQTKNAINPQLWIALADALRTAARDRDLRAPVITGAGGAFCSGADISMPDDVHPQHKLRRLTDVALALHELAVPTIAKVTGVAVGTGRNLALGCDFVVATPESQFCQIFSKRGLSVHEALANEARAQPGNFATADSTEAYAAFADKRAPSFAGRWLHRREQKNA